MTGVGAARQASGPDPAAWALDRLTELDRPSTGRPEVVRSTAWSAVARIPTGRGPVWVKAVAPALRREVRVHLLLASRHPGVVPGPLAADPGAGLLLLDDAGERLRDLVARTRDLSPWEDVLRRYAALQVAAAADVPDLLALGVPDLRPAVLAARYPALLDALDAPDAPVEEAAAGGPAGVPGRRDLLRRLRRATEMVGELAGGLAGSPVPATVQHDDLNDGQAFRGAGGWTVLDWGDACVSHPFLSLAVPVEGVIAWGPDDVQGSVGTEPFVEAYLGAFANLADPARLRQDAAAAIRLGWVCRAVNGHDAGLEDPDRTWTRLSMFLDGRPL